MKKYALLFLIGMAIAGCAKSPGGQETGFQGIPWGANATTVAKVLKLTSSPTNADSLFASFYQGAAPKLGVLLQDGFRKLVTGKDTPKPSAISLPVGTSLLDDGAAGYSLFITNRFAMNLRSIPASDYQSEHDRLMKKYGVIDRKVEYRANEYETSYMIQWHNADGIVILAKETFVMDPAHPIISTQIIHMDKHVFDDISSKLSGTGKTGT